MPRGFASLPLPKVYQLIEPGPVVLLSTAEHARANVMAMSWHMMVEFEPPLIACVVSGANYSFHALKATRQCVIAIPAAKLLQKVVHAGNCSGRDTDKFAAFKLTPLPAAQVSAPLIRECFANLECTLHDARMVRDYNLFILEVVQAWARRGWQKEKMLHHRGFGSFVLDGRQQKTNSRMR